MTEQIKNVILAAIRRLGYEVIKTPKAVESDEATAFYKPLFSPWLGFGEFSEYIPRMQPYTLVSLDRCYVLYILARQALRLPGEVWECGVYRGGTAMLLQDVIRRHSHLSPAHPPLRLFDSFTGMPDVDNSKDVHRKGDLSDTSLEAVQSRLGEDAAVHFHPGFIPDTMEGLEDAQIALAHIDVDIYQSVHDCCEFIAPRMVRGGFMVFDDYGFPSCPGAREAVDAFFKDRSQVPLALPTGQAIVFFS
jgi:O-methyltransferase